MSTGDRTRSPYRIVFLDLAACLAGFSLAMWLFWGRAEQNYFTAWPWERYRQLAVSAALAWVGVALTEDEWRGAFRLWIDRFFTIVGLNLMLQYGLANLFAVHPTPWPIAVAGAIFTLVLGNLTHRVFDPLLGWPAPVLLVGNNSMAEALNRRLGRRVAGILDCDPESMPRTLPALGNVRQLDQTVASTHAGHVLITDGCWRRQIQPRQLLALRYEGIAVEDGRLVYEDVLQRICWERLQPLELLTASSLAGNRAGMALQAIYTNLIGLGLLLAATPVLIICALTATLATGASPFETRVCRGFQRIPFRLLRFRTRRRNGEYTRTGRVIEALHLTHLPRLINVVRGEMALFGPPPVREEFADRLSQLLFAYVHRFAVKPGLFGWSQCNLPGELPDEMVRLEYDLYYAREESPSLDLDILFRAVFRLRLPAAGPIQARGVESRS